MTYTRFYIILSVVLYVDSKPLKKPAISLSPLSWDAEVFSRLETISMRKNTRPKPLVYSKKQGLVSGTTSVLAVHAGIEALRNGGNAMDACIATSMAEISLTAGSKVSFAGVTNILYYDHVTGRTHNVDAGWKIPKYRNMEDKPTMETLGDSVLVPGFIAGIHEAAEFSKFPLRTLLEPALYFAEEGFKMSHELSKKIQRYYKRTLRRTAGGKIIFTNPVTMAPYKPGELFRQPQLAGFIKNLQRFGKNYMYRGDWARNYIKTINQHGGKMTSRDMAGYEPQWLEPASTTYGGYHVTTSGSKWGGVELIEMLQLLKQADLSSANDSYLTNSTKLQYLMSISQYSQFLSEYLNARREGLGTISDFFQIDGTPKGRTSIKSALVIWSHLCNIEGVDMINQYFKELLSDLPNFDQHRELKRGSAGIVAIDNKGNVCAMSHTANSNPWGTGLFVNGVALPHSGAVFQDFLGRLRPGSHIPSGLQPVIIFRQEKREEKEKKLNEREEIPVRVTDKPVHVSTEYNMGPIGPRVLWKTTDKNIAVTEEISRPTKVKPTKAGKSADQRTGVKETADQKIVVTQNPFQKKLNRGPWSTKTTFVRNTKKPRHSRKEYEMGPLIGPRGVWESAVQYIAVPQQLRPTTTGSTVMRKTADQGLSVGKSRTQTTEPTDLLMRGRKSFRLRPRSQENKVEKRLRNPPEIEKENVHEADEEEKDEDEEKEDEKKEDEKKEEEDEEKEEEDEEDNNEVERELEPIEEAEEEDDEEQEPLSIGGLYTENDIKSIFGRTLSPKGNIRRLKETRKQWFQNIVRQIFQRQRKTHEQRQNKIYKNKRTKRKRWSKPFAALSVVGQSAPEAILQYIHNLIDNKMDVKQASDTPMFFSTVPGSHRQTIRVERFIFSSDVISEVVSRAQDVTAVLRKVGRVISGKGAVLAVTDRQLTYGCSHPDSEGFAEGQ